MFRKRRGRGSAGFGLVLIGLACVTLWMNEKFAVQEYAAIRGLNRTAVTVSPAVYAPELDGKIVHVQGGATHTAEPLVDARFGVAVAGLRLRRSVEMYQWEEKKSRAEGSDSATVSYRHVWSDERITDGEFVVREGHQNPPMPFQNRDWTAADVAYGEGYTLPAVLIERLKNFEPVPPEDANLTEVAAIVDGPVLFVGGDPGRPAVGDLRVRFEYVPLQQVSVIAQQVGRSLQQVQTKGLNYSIVRPGVLSKDNMINQANAGVATRTFGVRISGFLMMLFGMRLALSPLGLLVQWVPVLGRLVGIGLTLVAGSVAAVLSLSIISLSWLFHRPLLSAGLALCVLAIVVVLARQKAARAPGEAVVTGAR